MAILKIAQIHCYLDKATLRLVQAFITTRLDSFISLLYELPDKDLAKIQARNLFLVTLFTPYYTSANMIALVPG